MQNGDRRNNSHPHGRWAVLFVATASLVVSLPFCNKAFHIDDTLYLSIARQILRDPWRPFSGEINWQQVTEPAWNVSISPPGYSYWLAAWIKLGVTSEVGLHLAGSFWTVLLAVATHAWARRLVDWPVSATILVVASPTVAAGQNLMLDVPMLALAVSAVVLYLAAADRNSVAWAIAAGCVAGLAANVKYSGVVATGVMAVDAILARRWRLLAAAAAGLLLLAAGQVASQCVYGTSQLVRSREWIGRLFPSTGFDVLHRISTSLVYLGASTGWLALLAPSLWRRSWATPWSWLMALGGAAAAVLDLRHTQPEAVTKELRAALVHAAAFAFCGWLVLAWLGAGLVRRWFSRGDTARPAGDPSSRSGMCWRDSVMVFVWTTGFWYLGALNGPFIAPRAMLPCVLGLILAVMRLARGVDRLRVAWRVLAIVLTMLMGLAVGVGDYRYAAMYREWAPRIAERYRPAQGTLYYVGHWGWQHYADAAGMVPFDPARTVLQRGDVIVLPVSVDHQQIPAEALLRLERIAIEQVTLPKRIPRTRDTIAYISFHGDTGHGRVPWGWSVYGDLMERFVILRFAG